MFIKKAHCYWTGGSNRARIPSLSHDISIEAILEQPDYEYVHKELKHIGVMFKLLWQEYQDKCKTSESIPMGYTKYCKGYTDYTIVDKLTNHLEATPGVKAGID